MSRSKFLPEEWSVHISTTRICVYSNQTDACERALWWDDWLERKDNGIEEKEGNLLFCSGELSVLDCFVCTTWIHANTWRENWWCREASQSTTKHLLVPAECIINKKIRCVTVRANFAISKSIWVFVKACQFLSALKTQPAVSWWHSVDDTSCWQWTWSENVSHNITAGRWEDLTTKRTYAQTCKRTVALWLC